MLIFAEWIRALTRANFFIRRAGGGGGGGLEPPNKSLASAPKRKHNTSIVLMNTPIAYTRSFACNSQVRRVMLTPEKKRVESLWNRYGIEQEKSHAFDFIVQSHNDFADDLKSFIKSKL